MKYIYTVIFGFIDGYIQLPENKERIILNEIIDGTEVEAILTTTFNQYCFDLDRLIARGTLILRQFFQSAKFENKESAVEQEILDIQERRKTKKEKNATKTFLVIRFTDTTDIVIRKPMEEIGDLVVCSDEFDRAKIKSQHTFALHALLANFSLCAEISRIEKLQEGVAFYDDQSRLIFSPNFDARIGGVYITGSITDTVIYQITEELRWSLTDEESRYLGNTYRLLIESLAKNDDPFLSFSFAWMALEIFINKIFKDYKERFINNFKTVDLYISQYFTRIEDVMKDKYSLADKFNIIAGLLVDEQSFQDDWKLFREMKDTRNELQHGVEMDYRRLPNIELQKLLIKYLKLHIARQKNKNSS